MKELKYRIIRGSQLFNNCPYLEKFSDNIDSTVFPFPPKVGSGYCKGICKFFLYHIDKKCIIGCNYPEEVSWGDRLE